jgi:hypothetical protein
MADRRTGCSGCFRRRSSGPATAGHVAAAMRRLANRVAQRSVRERADMAALTLAGTGIGAAFAATFAIDDDRAADFAALLGDPMTRLEAGLRL